MKPRLAEILGVEVNEEFSIKNDCCQYRINELGDREIKSAFNIWHEYGCEIDLTRIINDPSLIIKQKHFSDDEKAFMRLLVGVGLHWLARDKNGRLYAFSQEPCRLTYEWNTDDTYDEVFNDFFPQITWEDEPINMNEVI